MTADFAHTWDFMVSSLQQNPTVVTPNSGAVKAIIVQQGKILDFIDGSTQRPETPEEYVRQEISKSLVREYAYAKSDVSVEFTLKLGSRKPRADLVIFPPGAPHKQENARLIVECKAQNVKSSDRKEGVGQLHSYMSACPNVLHGMWTNGIERFCYRRIETKGEVVFEEVADIPTVGKDDADLERPTFDNLSPATSDALLFAFRRCHNYIAANQGLQKPEAFWELLKLIFCKSYDEKYSDEIDFFAGATERHGINGHLKVKARVDELFEKVKADYGAIFRANDQIDLEPRVLTYLVSQLQKYSLLDSDTDVKGRAYEEIVGSNLRGDRGEFFTPRNICQMAVAMLDPDEGQLILDPACGTGGFLITAMNHVIAKIRERELAKWNGRADRAAKTTEERIRRFAIDHITGIDFNPNLVKASKMNMVMNNDGAGGLFQGNSLENPMLWNDDLRARDLIGKVDLLFTNPPFGSKIPIEDAAILERFELGHIWEYDDASDVWARTERIQRSQPPEILFIERCVKFLKPGTGRAALVLPDGILGSPGLGYVRDWILTNCRVLASVDLHPDTFQPHVSIQTSLLILERKTESQIQLEAASGQMQNYEVFLALGNHVGHDKRGNTTYVRDEKGNERVEARTRPLVEIENGVRVTKLETAQIKVVDDNTLQIAAAFRTWLKEHHDG